MNKYILLWSWAVFNLLIGIWELYAFYNRKSLKLEKETIWQKIKNGTTTFTTFFLDAWSEYSKVDSRYITNTFCYVWNFELCNAVLSIIFILVLLNNNTKWIKLILLFEIINTVLYFTTLGFDALLNNNMVYSNMITYASRWMFPVYYLISSIWILIPYLLLSL